jgi:hypothetical protein
MQGGACVGAQADDVASIRWYLRLEKCDMEHYSGAFCRRLDRLEITRNLQIITENCH